MKLLVGIGGLLAELACGDFDVLFGERVSDVERGKAAGGEAGGIKPETHGIFALAEDDGVTDAGNALKRILDVNVDVVGDEGCGQRLVRGDESDGKHKVWVGLGNGDAGVINDCGQTALNRCDAVLHVDRCDIEVVTGIEGDGDGGGAVVRAGGAHVPHAFDAVDGLLEDGGNCGFDVLGVGSDVDAGDNDLRRRKLGIERDGQSGYADGAGEHDEKSTDRGEDRATNKKVYEQGDL